MDWLYISNFSWLANLAHNIVYWASNNMLMIEFSNNKLGLFKNSICGTAFF